MLYWRKLQTNTSPCSTCVILPFLAEHHSNSIIPPIPKSLAYNNHGSANSILFGFSYSTNFGINPETKIPKTLCSTIVEPVLVQARDPSQLALDLENAIDEKRYDDAWTSYEKHLHMSGYPRKSVLTKFITGLTETFDSQWLNKAYGIVESVFKESKYDLLEREPLIYLSFILARCQLSVLALNTVRKLIHMDFYPPGPAWSAIVGHMCQSTTGTFLAMDLIMEIGYLFNHNRVDPRKKSNAPLLAMKPTTLAFNLALTGSIIFGTTKKAEQLIELMPAVGLRPDSKLFVTIVCVNEKNGYRDEVKKLKRYVEESIDLTDSDLERFYDSLFSCNLKFGDLDCSVDLVLDMLRKAKEAKKSLSAAKSVLKSVENRKSEMETETKTTKLLLPYQKSENDFTFIRSPPPTFLSFSKDRDFSRFETEAKELLQLLTQKVQEQVELVKSECGILHPTEKMYAKLIRSFLEYGNINKLASFLIRASKEESPVSIEWSTPVQVINACISLGLLEQAHDLLDEMRFHGIWVGSTVYSSLLRAYCEQNRKDEIFALLNDARQAGVQLDSSCYELMVQSRLHQNDPSGALNLFKEMKNSNLSKTSPKKQFDSTTTSNYGDETTLMGKLLEEIKHNPRADHGLHDWNSVIHFFCKKRMMRDAQKAYQKMRYSGQTPNAQTFHSLVSAYAAIGGKYTEVTDLWGEMKSLAGSGSSSINFDQELLDLLLYCFVRGGFFLRAMEVIEMMERRDLFIDKYKYRSLWLKYHKTLYKGKAPKVQTEAQVKRREAALTFKRWVGLT